MVTLLVGLSVVAVSAAGFWLVLFSHNPAVRVAGRQKSQGDSPARAESMPSTPIPVSKAEVLTPTRFRKGIPMGVPIVSRKRRVRSALILAIATIGVALLIGAVLSIVVVVAVLVLT